MNKFLKNHYLIICLYGLLLIVILLGYGDLYGSRVDWLCQHVAFPDVFRQAYYKTGELVPQMLFELGAGQNAFHYTYYGFLSPAILLSYAFPFIDMTIYMMGWSIISYLLSGCLIYRFFKKHFYDKIAFGIGILFLTSSPLTFHFHHHIMFVWYLPYFLLALIGLDRYFEKKKSGLFIISAFGLILTNYMFSVGCLVYLFVYAVYCLLKENTFPSKTFLKKFVDVVFLFIIPVCMSAFLLFPTAYTLFASSRSSGNGLPWYDLLVPNLGELFYRPFTIGLSAIILVVIFCNLFSTNRKKEDVFLNLFLLAVIICPVILYVLNGTLYVRGKVLIACSVLFLYSFCVFLEHLEKEEIDLTKSIKYSFALVIICIILHIDQWQTGLILLIELTVLKIFKDDKRVWYITPIVTALVSTLVVNIRDESYVTMTYYDEMHQNEIIELMEATEGSYYRTNIAYREMDTGNRVYGDNFYGTSLYSSTYNPLYAEFYQSYMGNNEKYRNNLMNAGAMNEMFYHFMGTKYIISKKDPGLYYELKERGENLNLYENVNAFPIVYKSDKLMSQEEFSTLSFPYSAEALMNYTIVSDVNSNEFLENINTSTLEKIDILPEYSFIYEFEESDEIVGENKNKTYEIELDESYKNKIIYLSFDINNVDENFNSNDIYITINGIKNKLTYFYHIYYNENSTFEYVIPMEKTNTLSIELTEGKYDLKNIQLYISEPIITTHDPIDTLQIDEASSIITCSVSAEAGEYLVTSIPYDKGFTARINGKEVETQIVNTAFLGIPLEEGENQIEIIYHTPLYQEGVWGSYIGVAFWGIKSLLDRRKTNENISCSTLL